MLMLILLAAHGLAALLLALPVGRGPRRSVVIAAAPPAAPEADQPPPFTPSSLVRGTFDISILYVW